MLTSLSLNGDVPEATIVVVGFGLNEEDRGLLRAGAGRMAHRLQFIEVGRDDLRDVDRGGYTDIYPPSVLGRLFIANKISESSARLLTVDSDMIINSSLKPLFEIDLGDDFFAAIHDPPRREDPNYFNSGLMLTLVADYNRHDVAGRSIRWLAEQSEHPKHPDQDALNAVIGDSWYRLDRSWNFFFFEGEVFTTEGYEGAKVAHFAGGPKPWDYADHTGALLYNRYLAKLRVRCDEVARLSESAGREFLASCYEVFLGRSLESELVVHDRARWSKPEVVRSVVQSSEFQANALKSVRAGEALPDHIFDGRPTIRQRFWAADQLPLRSETRALIATADNWPDLLKLILDDQDFSRLHELSAV